MSLVQEGWPMGSSGRRLGGGTREKMEYISSFLLVSWLLQSSSGVSSMLPDHPLALSELQLGDPRGSSSHRTALFLGSDNADKHVPSWGWNKVMFCLFASAFIQRCPEHGDWSGQCHMQEALALGSVGWSWTGMASGRSNLTLVSLIFSFLKWTKSNLPGWVDFRI